MCLHNFSLKLDNLLKAQSSESDQGDGSSVLVGGAQCRVAKCLLCTLEDLSVNPQNAHQARHSSVDLQTHSSCGRIAVEAGESPEAHSTAANNTGSGRWDPALELVL